MDSKELIEKLCRQIDGSQAWVMTANIQSLMTDAATALEQADERHTADGATIVKLRIEANELRERAEKAAVIAKHTAERIKSDRCAWSAGHERDEARAELARIKGAALPVIIQCIADAHGADRGPDGDAAREASALRYARVHRSALLDAVRVLTAQLAAEKAYSKCLTAGGEELTRDKYALLAQVESAKNTPRCYGCKGDFVDGEALGNHIEGCADHPLGRALAIIDRVRSMIRIWNDGDEPEGELSSRMVLNNILLAVGAK